MRVAQSLHARLRSTTGVVIGLYVTMHLSNHALGLVSQNAQEAARPYVMALWHSLPGPVLLYGSFVTHAVCALIALARRREFRPALKVNLLPSITLRLLLLCLACLGLTRRMSAAPIAGEISKDTALFLPEFFSINALPPSLALVESPKVHGPLAPGWTLKPEFSQANGKSRVTLALPPGTSLYGEGEVAGPLLRNNTDTVLWNTDNAGYRTDNGRRLYQSHPWLMGVRPDGTAFGFLADTTYHAEIKTTDTLIDFVSDGPPFPVIIVEGASPQEIMQSLAKLIGTAPLRPRWTLGYQQCRWSYQPDSRVRQIADEFRTRKIPCDVIWMDIDYMDGFRDFTFDPKKFPDPRGLNTYLHDQGYHSIWMIDPGVKAQPGYGIYDSGTEHNIWCKEATGGKPYVGNVWPGPCVFPDFTRPDARAWWADQYKLYMATGIDGVWNDMNEPAVFNGPDHSMPTDVRHAGGGGLPAGTEAQYHNVFGMLEVRASREGIRAANPDKRPFVLSRSGYLGSQRYGATWTGDNQSTWEHFQMSIPMSISLGLAGQPMSGPDCGGFGGTATPELWAHWIAVDAFFPFCRGHSAKDTPNKEPWAFGEPTETVARTALERRYRLLPYLYTLFQESSRSGMPVMRPIFFADPKDTQLRSEQQAFLVGGDVMIVPKWARALHVPAGWVPTEIVPGENAPPNDQYQPEVRLRPGSVVPLGAVVQNTNEESLSPLTLLVCPDARGEAQGTLYEDAGDGYGYQHGDYLLTTYHAHKESNDEVITLGTEGQRAHAPRKVVVHLVTAEGVHEANATDAGPIRVSASLR